MLCLWSLGVVYPFCVYDDAILRPDEGQAGRRWNETSVLVSSAFRARSNITLTYRAHISN
jgi:hypothetical protein